MVGLRFRHKVFVTFLLSSLVMIACMVLIARYYAARNFENYVNKMEMTRLNELAEELSREYGKTGNWAPIIENIGPWFGILGHRFGPQPPFPAPDGNPHPDGPPPEAHRILGGPPPPDGPPLPPYLPSGPPSPPHRARQPHIALFDADKKPMSPPEITSAEGYRLKAIQVDGELVGWLGIKRHERPVHPLDMEFLRLQSKIFYSTAGVVLLLSILVTFILSRHLLAPVKLLAEGTRALTSRKFETRIQVRSRDELGQLAADFNNMARALARYEQMRRQWLADISHELRTPLAILRGEIEAMQDGVREITPEALDSLHFEVLHVSRIVHDLHELSLIESQSFDTEKTEVIPLDVLEETVRVFQPRFDQCGIKIETAGSDCKRLPVMANADRLKQLFSNLLENTLRYSHSPGVLTISNEIKPGPGLLVIHFEDSGPGVPEQSLGRLFDRLYRVDKARSRAKGGSGLGLAICKSIVEWVGGSIEAANAPGGGLRITVAFPLVRAE